LRRRALRSLRPCGDPAGGATEHFAATTPFTLKARFTDDDNLVEPGDFPFPTPPGFTDGFVAYSPFAATMDIGGAVYTVAS
jgi:hypothetical protein